MNFKRLVCLLLLLLGALGICSCGNGGTGRNGSLEVNASVTGSFLDATATYKNPTHTDLTGVPITFFIQVNNIRQQLGDTIYTNNSGSVTVGVPLAALNISGTTTVTVIAQTGNLEGFDSVDVTGRTVAVTPPPAPALALSTPVGTPLPVTLPAFDSFINVSDPISNNINGHVITISGVSSNGGDTVSLVANQTVTDATGKAPFPGATVTLVPPAVAGTVNRVITWTITDTTINQTKTAITVLTLTAT